MMQSTTMDMTAKAVAAGSLMRATFRHFFASFRCCFKQSAKRSTKGRRLRNHFRIHMIAPGTIYAPTHIHSPQRDRQ